jgi:hypothetical protein
LAAIEARGGNAQNPCLEPFYEAALRDRMPRLIGKGLSNVI